MVNIMFSVFTATEIYLLALRNKKLKGQRTEKPARVEEASASSGSSLIMLIYSILPVTLLSHPHSHYIGK